MPEENETPAPEAAGNEGADQPDLDPKTEAWVKKVNQEAQSLRERLRGTEKELLVQKFGEPVIAHLEELEVPPEKWGEKAPKVAASLGSQTASAETASEDAAQGVAPVAPPDVAGMAALNSSPGAAQGASTKISHADFKAMYATNPAEALKYIGSIDYSK